MVVFDTSFLFLAFDEGRKPPQDPQTGQVLAQWQARVSLLMMDPLTSTKILIPTPVLAEYLVKAGRDKAARLAKFTSSKLFRVASFGVRAAVECALLAESDGNRKPPKSPEETRVKVKFDRQIIAIAKVENAHTIYTDDGNLAKKARACGLTAVLPSDLPLPPQSELFE